MIPPISDGGRINEVIHIEMKKECTMYDGKVGEVIIPRIKKRLEKEGLRISKQALENRIKAHYGL